MKGKTPIWTDAKRGMYRQTDGQTYEQTEVQTYEQTD